MELTHSINILLIIKCNFNSSNSCITYGLQILRKFNINNIILIFSRVVAIDLRGYGDSDKPKGLANYKTNVLVDDLRQLVLALGASLFGKCLIISIS